MLTRGDIRCGTDYGAEEQFYSLLLTYADTIASSSSDLGRTDKLSHSIHT